MLGILLLSLASLTLGQNTPAAVPVTQPAPSGFMPICDPDSYTPSGPPVPYLPDQFSFTIEGNLLERNSTAVMTEYYDGPGNRGRIEFGINGSSTYSIFDYTMGEIFLIPDYRSGDDCRVYPIADGPRFLNRTFGIVNQNGSIHIGTPRTFIENLRDDTASKYLGEAMVRGILAQHWQACFGGENISYLIDYFFVDEPWNYDGQGRNLDETQMVPIQFTLNTIRIDSNGMVRNISHIYSVVDFQAGPDSVPDSMFRVPNGLACTGRFPGQAVPLVPQFFSTYYEGVYSVMGINRIQTVKEFYDLPNKLYRTDFFNPGRNGTLPPGPTSIIHDFDSSTQYVIGTQVLNCSAQPLSQYAPYFPDIAVGDDDGLLQLVSPNNIFFFGEDFNYSYEGISNIRGVDCDSWVSVRDFQRVAGAINLTNAIYEVFFTRPGWVYSTDRSINTDPVPWRIKISGMASVLNMLDNSTITINGTFQRDYFDFSAEEPNYDAFDISLCSGPNDYHTILMLIPGQEKGIDFGQLRRNIRTGVSNYTGLKPLQIGNIQIVRENGTHVYVTFHISNLTSIAKKNVPNTVTSDMAVQLLTNNTRDSILPFKIQISEKVFVSPILRQVGRGNRNGTSATCTNTTTMKNGTDCKNNFTNRLGLTDNIVAGIAVVLFLFGVTIGVVFVLVCIGCVHCWRSTGTGDLQRAAKPVRYQRQKDDVHVT